MNQPLTFVEMAANVALSRGHVTKQEAIIARLTAQGHIAMADDARTLLASMQGHLALEVKMLERMQAKPAADT